MSVITRGGKPIRAMKQPEYTRDDLKHIPEAALGMACCHTLAMGDYRDFVSNHPEVNKILEKLTKEGLSISDIRNTPSSVQVNHMAMMQRALEICKREGINVGDYREAMVCVRRMAKDAVVDLAIDSEFFEELVPEELRVGIISHVMDI